MVQFMVERRLLKGSLSDKEMKMIQSYIQNPDCCRVRIMSPLVLQDNRSILPGASALLCHREGGICVTLFTAPSTACGQIIMAHSSFSERGGPTRKDRKGACSWLDELESLGTVPTLCPPLMRGHTEGLKLLLIMLMSGGTDFAECSLMGVGSQRGEGVGLPWAGRWQTLSIRVSDRQMSYGKGWQRPSEAFVDQHGVLLLVYQSADPVTPLTGNTVAAQWRDLASVEEVGQGRVGVGRRIPHETIGELDGRE